MASERVSARAVVLRTKKQSRRARALLWRRTLDEWVSIYSGFFTVYKSPAGWEGRFVSPWLVNTCGGVWALN
jgi:hypothetical protein